MLNHPPVEYGIPPLPLFDYAGADDRVNVEPRSGIQFERTNLKNSLLLRVDLGVIFHVLMTLRIVNVCLSSNPIDVRVFLLCIVMHTVTVFQSSKPSRHWTYTIIVICSSISRYNLLRYGRPLHSIYIDLVLVAQRATLTLAHRDKFLTSMPIA